MNANQGIVMVLEELRQNRKLTNSQMLRLLEGDEKLLREVRETLILDDLAQDKDGVGLILRGAATPEAMNKAHRPKLFLSYGRRDAKELADRLTSDLKSQGFDVWQDIREVISGESWQHEITDGLRSAQIVIALLSPHSVRTTADPESSDGVDSTCLGEIAYALFQPPPKPVVPVMAATCEPPLAIFHLDYVDLTRWRDSNEQYQAGLEKLLKAIEAARRGEKRYRSWHHQLKPWDFAAFLHEKRRDFIGREWLFEEIDAWRASTQHERALLITGDPGTGKSAIVAELVHRNPGGQVIGYHCCQADTPATLEPWRFVRSIAAMIASRLPQYAAQLEDPSVQELLAEETCRLDPAGALERAVFAPLETLAAPEEGVRYLLVDALDESLTLGRGLTIVQLLASRLNRLPGWLRIVATTRKEPEVLNRLRGLRAQEVDAQDPQNQADVGAYIRHRLDSPNMNAVLTRSGTIEATISYQLLEKSAGNFLYVRQALDAFERGTYSLENLQSLPAGLYGLYDAFFRRQFGEQGESYSEAKQILEVIVAATEPLTREELGRACGLNPYREIPVLLNRMATFVPARTDEFGRITYNIFHKSLADWLTKPDLLGTTFHLFAEDGHQKLAQWGLTEYREGVGNLSSYQLRHLPNHLIHTQDWDELENILMNLTYLEQRAKANQLFELILDFDSVATSRSNTESQPDVLSLLGEALRREAHFIAQHVSGYPQILFQCFWNNGWWYDCPEAERHYDPPKEKASSEMEAWDWQGPRLFTLLESWRSSRDRVTPGFSWLRARRPPKIQLGGPMRAVLYGHESGIKSIAYSPDGMRIASGSRDGTVRIWDAVSGAEIAVLRGHENSVGCVAYSPDGTQIASGAYDNSIRIWDSRAGREVAILQGHTGPVQSVVFSSNGQRIVSGARDRDVRIWDTQKWINLAVLSGHEGLVSCVDIAPDGTQIVSGSGDHTIRVWDVSQEKQVLILNGHDGLVTSVKFSSNRSEILSGSWDQTVRIWDAKTGALNQVLAGHDRWVQSVCYSPDYRIVISGSSDKMVGYWNPNRVEPLAMFRGHEDGVLSVAHSPTQYRIASGSEDGTLRIWDTTRQRNTRMLKGHRGNITSLACAPDGRRVSSGSDDATIRIWHVQSCEELAILRGHTDRVESLIYSRDGQQILSGSSDKTIRVWDAHAGKPLMEMSGHGDTVTSLALTPWKDSWLVSGSSDGTVRLWDRTSGRELVTFCGHERAVTCVAVSSDGKWITSGSRDMTIRVWNIESGGESAVLRGHGRAISSVAFLENGKQIISGSEDQTVRVWDNSDADESAVVGEKKEGYWESKIKLEQGCNVDGCGNNVPAIWDIVRGVHLEFDAYQMGKGFGVGDNACQKLQVVVTNRITRFQEPMGGQSLGMFPARLFPLVSHPSKREWIGGVGSHLVFLTLEGTLDSPA